MKTNLFNARHHGGNGPGGWRCGCCGPCPKDRKFFARLYKKRTYKLLDKLERDDNKA